MFKEGHGGDSCCWTVGSFKVSRIWASEVGPEGLTIFGTGLWRGSFSETAASLSGFSIGGEGTSMLVRVGIPEGGIWGPWVSTGILGVNVTGS